MRGLFSSAIATGDEGLDEPTVKVRPSLGKLRLPWEARGLEGEPMGLAIIMARAVAGGQAWPIDDEKTQDVLIQKGQLDPILEREENAYTDAEWKFLDAKARSTIRLHLAESVYFTIVGESTAKEVWDKLCANYENKSASNKVYLMKKLFDLRMKEGGTVLSHLNKFNIISTN
ncbi:hypothetical protein L7F22_024696 [Adiantum nelumboides]|nr:hypothetical protein [Adiantum nelumboides]